MTTRRESVVVFSYVFLAILCFLLVLALFLLLPVKQPGQRATLHSIQSSVVEWSAPLDYWGTRSG